MLFRSLFASKVLNVFPMMGELPDRNGTLMLMSFCVRMFEHEVDGDERRRQIPFVLLEKLPFAVGGLLLEIELQSSGKGQVRSLESSQHIGVCAPSALQSAFGKRAGSRRLHAQ